MVLYEGATTLPSRTSTDETHGFVLLFVDGDLTVEGNLIVEDDPHAFVIVTGSLTVTGSVLTSGFLEVQGKTTVAGVVIGDYNHGVAIYNGDVMAGGIVDCGEFQLVFRADQAAGRLSSDGAVAEQVVAKISEGADSSTVLALLA